MHLFAEEFPGKNRNRLGLLFLTLALFILLCPSVRGQEKNPDPDSIPPILQDKKDVINDYQARLNEIEDRIPELTKQLQSQLESLQPKLNILLQLKGFIRNNYKETMLLKKNISGLKKEIDNYIKPLNSIFAELEELQKILNQHEEELKDRYNFTSMFETDKAAQRALEKDLKTVGSLLTLDKKLQARIRQNVKPVEKFKEQIASLEKEIEDDLSQAWQDYFLVPSAPVFTIPIKQQIDQVNRWWQDLPVYLQFFLLGKLSWGQFALKCAGIFVLFFSLLLIAIFWIRSKIPDLSLGQILLANLFLCLGLGIFLSHTFIHFQYQSILLPVLWQISLSLGIITGLWSVRTLLLTQDGRIKNPLFILWLLFSLSLILQNLTLPLFMLQIIWVIILIAFSFWLKKYKSFYKESFERYITLASIVFLVVFALVSFGGWINLSILFTSLWFVICINMQFGNIVTRLLKQKAAKFPDTHIGYLGRGILQGTGIPLLWIFCLFNVVLWLNLAFGDFTFLQKLSTLKVGWGKASINLARLILIVISFYLARSGIILLKSILNSFSKPKGQLDSGTVASLQTLLVYVVWAVFIILALALLGLNLTSLTVVAGGLSVGIGFGLQSILNNFISGLILLFGRSIQPGDILQLGDLWAEVKEVNIRATEIETFDRSTLLVPNSMLIGEQITNWTHRDRTVRRRITVGLAYGSDTQLAKRLLIEVAENHKFVYRLPKPFVRFSDFGESSLVFTLYFYSTIDNGWMAESDLRFEIDRVFKENGIVISFPQRDLHLRTAPALEPLMTKEQSS